MDRRGFLSGTLALTVFGAASGCLDGGAGGPVDDPNGGDGGSPTPTGDDSDPADGTPTGTDDSDLVFVDRSFRRTGDCPADDAGLADVSFGETKATVTGCITGKNGCQQAALGDVEYDSGTDTVTVVVTTTAGEETPDVCTQQLVHRAYEATVTFGDRLPSAVVAVHESMGERTEAGRAESG